MQRQTFPSHLLGAGAQEDEGFVPEIDRKDARPKALKAGNPENLAITWGTSAAREAEESELLSSLIKGYWDGEDKSTIAAVTAPVFKFELDESLGRNSAGMLLRL